MNGFLSAGLRPSPGRHDCRAGPVPVSTAPARTRRTRRALSAIACAQRPIFGCGRQRRGPGKPARRAAFYSFVRNLQPFRSAGAAWRDALWCTRHRQDAHGAGPGGRGGRAVFRGQRCGLCGDVRGRGRKPCARTVPGGAQGRTRGHIL